jgi:hypothetical protein
MKSPERPISPENILDISPEVARGLWSAAFTEVDNIGPEIFSTEESVFAVAEAAKKLAELLPLEVIQAGRALSVGENLDGALVIRGLQPLEELTRIIPTEKILPRNRSANAAGLATLALANTIGSPVSHKANPRGHVATFLGQTAPLLEEIDTFSLAGARDSGWHAEAGGMTSARPVAVGLYCIREQDVVTNVVPSKRLVERLSKEDLSILQEAQFRTPDAIIPASQSMLRPIVDGTLEDPYFTLHDLYPGMNRDLPKRTRQAIANLYTILDDPTLPTGHVIRQGEFYAMSNRGVHKRDEFKPDWEAPRWLLRTFISGDMDAGPFV